MASKFAKYGVATCEDMLYQMYYFVVSSGQTAVRLVNDTGSAVALYKGGVGFVSSWASATDCPDGSYMVAETVTAVNGYRWQWKLTNIATNVLETQFAPRGGWTNAGAAFPSTASNLVQWNDGAAPGVGSQIYCGTGTFAISGSVTGTYLWFSIRDTASSTADQMIYGGHYYPFDIASDINPCCVLVGIPRCSNDNYAWGRNATDGTNNNRTSVEFAQSTSWNAAGYARVGYSDVTGSPGSTCIWRDLTGSYPPLPAYLWLGNTALMGHFGDHIRVIPDSLNDWDTGTTADPGSRIVMGHMWVHYDESL